MARIKGRLDIARITHRHALGGEDVVYRVVFYHQFTKQMLVRHFELFLTLKLGTTPAVPGARRYFHGLMKELEGLVFLRMYYLDRDSNERKLADAMLRKVGRTVSVRLPSSWFARAPYNYEWAAGSTWVRNGRFLPDHSGWLGHRIET